MTLQIVTRFDGKPALGKIVIRGLTQAKVNQLITDYAEAFSSSDRRVVPIDRLTFVVGD